MKRHKYRAVATTLDGVRFHSKREAARYAELRLLEKAGEIKELELQPKFPLYVCRRQNGELIQFAIYQADFRYREGKDGVLIVEDVKGVRTQAFSLKKRAFEAQYGMALRLT